MEKIDIEDIIFIIGIGLFAYGTWLYSPALSLTLTGVLFMLVGYMRAGGGNK